MRSVARLSILAIAFFIASALHAAEAPTKDVCLACHDTVNAAKFNASVHAPLECTNCHADVTAVPHEAKPKAVDCSSCHTEAVAAWDNSVHGKAVKSGQAKGARCVDCHGPAHEILPSTDKASKTYHTNIPQTCANCHGQKFVMQKVGLSAQSAISYEDSVHGRAAARGNMKAAVCTDCHDFHSILPPNNPQSGIFKFNVGRTCGKCHASIAGQYVSSVHGKALAKGNWNAPVCSDCHGIHTISKAADLTRGPRASCARCHDGVRLTREYAVAANRVSSYEHSYHGLARKIGSPVAADCASCHGAHDVLPSSDPKSSVNAANLQKTCGKCHKDATANFAIGQIHLDGDGGVGGPGGTPGGGGGGGLNITPTKAVNWIKIIYMILIVGTIGFMLLHNFLLWLHKARVARRDPTRTVVRMNLNQRIQHAVLVVSFVILVISGFALAWPNSFFAWFFGPSEALRRIVHRVAAVVMIAIGLYHLAYMTFTKEGRQGLKDLWVRFSDGRDVVNALAYSVGLSKKKPEFGRFSYAEKMEYWAGMWGTLVMALTGLVIWYAVAVATWVPRWWVDIATTIHFYEAILATLAILVWHLYGVIFSPDVYPMNWAWFDGKMSEEQYRHEHGLVASEAKTAEEEKSAKPAKVIGKEIHQGA